MDEMKIESKLMRSVVSKVISRMIYKKLGYKVEIKLDRFNASIIDGIAEFELAAQGRIPADEFIKVTKLIEDAE